MLEPLLRAGDERAVAVARSWLEQTNDDDQKRRLAVVAARTLLVTNGLVFWPEILLITKQDPQFSHAFALACATRHADLPLLSQADEEQLSDIYRWLHGLFPPQDDPPLHEGAHFVSPEEEAREWRDRILRQLSERGTHKAAAMLAELSKEYPDRLVIASALIRARANAFALDWSAPSPKDLAALFEDARRRLVRSEAELAELLVEVLNAIAADLPGHCELLWDRLPKSVVPKSYRDKEAWLPKPEAALSAYTAHELLNRLNQRGLAVNREVLVRPTDAYGAGERTDILIEATARDDPVQGAIPHRLAVVIEVKGAWNKDLNSAQREQLAGRYLPDAHTSTGIFLVGWYSPDLWTYRGDRRRARVTRIDRDKMFQELNIQASAISKDLGMLTVPHVLEIARPYRREESASGNSTHK
jgi:hypothetical protein